MKKLAMFALLAVVATACTSGYKQDSAASMYTKSSVFGNNDAVRPIQQQVQFQPAQE